jgi:large subunit ribosomal protein L4
VASIDIYSQDKKKLSSAELSARWDLPVSKGSIYETALWHMAGRRAGTSSTKSRSDVRGSGRKIYRQKGTGNARHADRQANIFVGGGITFGPKPKDWSYTIPKKERRTAIQSVLTHKLRQDKLRVLDSLDFGEIKTKSAKDFFSKWEITSALVVLDKPSDSVVKSMSNLPKFTTCGVNSLNVADLLLYDFVIMTKQALEIIERQWEQEK